MSPARPGIALDCRSFGRGPARMLDEPKERTPISDDLKLFATTFIAGFIFVSMLLT